MKKNTPCWLAHGQKLGRLIPPKRTRQLPPRPAEHPQMCNYHRDTRQSNFSSSRGTKTHYIVCTLRMVLIPICWVSLPGTTRTCLSPPQRWVDGCPHKLTECRPLHSVDFSAALLLVQRKGVWLASFARLDQLWFYFRSGRGTKDPS